MNDLIKTEFRTAGDRSARDTLRVEHAVKTSITQEVSASQRSITQHMTNPAAGYQR